jgi:hypothetical protein
MRILIIAQGVYYLVTGLWPLFHISSFEAVTGPKTDDWLVQTVGVLAAVIGATLIIGCRHRPGFDVVVLAALAAIGFAAVDIVFVSRGIISRIYLVDAVVQVLFLAALGLWSARNRRTEP